MRPHPGMVRRLDAASVFAGHREVVLVHRGQEYRLRITKANKLILTK
jgi:hemin uptake protein HemP